MYGCDDLKEVKNSPYSKSETRFVKPVRVDLEKIGGPVSEIVVLVDSPGAEDTESSEVDLSNGLGIVKAVVGTKGVRPIIIFSYMDLGSRKDKLKKQLKFYARMVKDLKRVVKNFTYCFSQVVDAINYAAMLQEIYSNLNSSEAEDESLKLIL